MRFILNLIGNIKIDFDSAFRVVISHSRTIVYVLFYALCIFMLLMIESLVIVIYKDYSISIILLQAIASDTYFGISANNNSFKTIDNINDTHIPYL